MNRLATIAAVAVAAVGVTVGGALPALAAVPSIKPDKAVISPGGSLHLAISCPRGTINATVSSPLLPSPYTRNVPELEGVPTAETTTTIRIVAGKDATPAIYTFTLICDRGSGDLQTTAAVIKVQDQHKPPVPHRHVIIRTGLGGMAHAVAMHHPVPS